MESWIYADIPRQCEGCCNAVSSLRGCKAGKASRYCQAYQWNLEMGSTQADSDKSRAWFVERDWKCPMRGIPAAVPEVEERRKEKGERVAPVVAVKKVVEAKGGVKRRGSGIKKL